MKLLRAPLQIEDIMELSMGDEVLVQGSIYAARDAAHKNMVQSLENGEGLPFDIEGQIIYYVGPCPAPPGKIIGSAGPTTSGRMDTYAQLLIEKGLKAMIGKGPRDQNVIEAMKKYGAVYLATVGGAGAYLARCIKDVETIAYPELGPESLLKMEVQDFPCVVAIDARGNDIYRLEKGAEVADD
ncbi:MAG: Fe-S-containing hydro-lyase [Syntrophomonadaceae bacterium]|nr:Fe-S-containing hydro-lyase [Syntrophomonadaceae bacterium]